MFSIREIPKGTVPGLLRDVLDMNEVELKEFIDQLSKESNNNSDQEFALLDPSNTRSLFLAQKEHSDQYFYDFRSTPFFFSVAPLKNLQRMRIQNLEVGKQAKGSYLLLRILEPPIECGGITILVEDHTGSVCILTLGLYIQADPKRSVKDELAVGTMFALKEPVLKIAARNSLVIFSSTSADFIKINQCHVLWNSTKRISWKNDINTQAEVYDDGLSALELKAVGNKLYKVGKCMEAIETYSVAVNKCENKDLSIILHLNLSAAYLATEYYELALKHTQKVLDTEAQNLKALYRSGWCHYQLRQYERSKRCYEQFLLLKPSDMDVAEKIKACTQRLKEKSGIIDIQKLNYTALTNPSTRIDCGDYFGPIEMVPSTDKGRTVASRDIARGALLAVSKAYAIDFDSNSYPTYRNQRVGTVQFEAIKLLYSTIQIMFKNPKSFGKPFYEFSSNDPERDHGYQLYCDEENEEEPIIDLFRIMLIIRENLFAVNTSQYTDLLTEKFSIALFGFPSNFNHSCVPNSTFQMYNDVIVIRANTLINKGEELTISSFAGLVTFSVACEGFLSREQFLSRRGFKCYCELCKLDRLDSFSVHTQRDGLMSQLQSLPPNDKDPLIITMLMKSMEHSYGPRRDLRLQLSEFWIELALNSHLFTMHDLPNIMATIDKALACFGLSCEILLKCAEDPQTHLPKGSVIYYNYLMHKVILPIITRCFMNRNMKEKDKWYSVLYMIEHVLLGGDLNTLKVKSEKILFFGSLFM